MKRRKDEPTPAEKSTGVEVTFTRTHHHAGREYQPGEVATVRPDTRERLVLFDVIEVTRNQ